MPRRGLPKLSYFATPARHPKTRHFRYLWLAWQKWMFLAAESEAFELRRARGDRANFLTFMALRVGVSLKQPASLLLVGTGNGNDRRYVVAEFRSWTGSGVVVLRNVIIPKRGCRAVPSIFLSPCIAQLQCTTAKLGFRKRTDVWRFVIVASLKRPLSKSAR
jgi:hypothetical protein